MPIKFLVLGGGGFVGFLEGGGGSANFIFMGVRIFPTKASHIKAWRGTPAEPRDEVFP